MPTVSIALGSNLGDRAAQLIDARRAIDALTDTAVTASSSVYETAPVGPIEQGAFLNAVLRVETSLDPQALLLELQAIESAAGRQRAQQWGPRTLDCDLLFFGDEVLESDDLQVPHPRIAERRFVLQPLCDIDPGWTHPVLNQSMRSLLDVAPSLDMRLVEVPGW